MPTQKSALYKAMLIAASRTFEIMAFVEVAEQSEEMATQTPEDPVWISILLHDPFQGEIRLALTDQTLTEITANIFGLDNEKVTAGQRNDIIAEILNTISGQFMANLLPDDQTYKLGLPKHATGPLPEAEADSIVWNLLIGGSPLLLVATGNDLIAENNRRP